MVIPVKTKETVAVNATAGETLIIKNAEGKKFTVLNCKGEEISQGEIVSNLQEINVPTAGMVLVVSE